jgi:hypothetical protein
MIFNKPSGPTHASSNAAAREPEPDASAPGHAPLSKLALKVMRTARSFHAPRLLFKVLLGSSRAELQRGQSFDRRRGALIASVSEAHSCGKPRHN